MSFANEKANKDTPKPPGLLYPMIPSQRVEATAKWKEQSTDVNYEINPEHGQLEERPKHQYPKPSHRDRQVPGPFRPGRRLSRILNQVPVFSVKPHRQSRTEIPPPLFSFGGGEMGEWEWGEVRRIARRKARTSREMIARIRAYFSL